MKKIITFLLLSTLSSVYYSSVITCVDNPLNKEEDFGAYQEYILNKSGNNYEFIRKRISYTYPENERKEDVTTLSNMQCNLNQNVGYCKTTPDKKNDSAIGRNYTSVWIKLVVEHTINDLSQSDVTKKSEVIFTIQTPLYTGDVTFSSESCIYAE